MKLTITDGFDAYQTTLADLLRDNADSPSALEAINAARPGLWRGMAQRVNLGAAGTLTIGRAEESPLTRLAGPVCKHGIYTFKVLYSTLTYFRAVTP